jgi:tetraacyldisaccharide-1-P 4'-kinase
VIRRFELEQDVIVFDFSLRSVGRHEEIHTIVMDDAFRREARAKNVALDVMNSEVRDDVFARPSFPRGPAPFPWRHRLLSFADTTRF